METYERYDDQEVWSVHDKAEHDRIIGQYVYDIKSAFEELRRRGEEGVVHELQDWIDAF